MHWKQSVGIYLWVTGLIIAGFGIGAVLWAAVIGGMNRFCVVSNCADSPGYSPYIYWSIVPIILGIALAVSGYILRKHAKKSIESRGNAFYSRLNYFIILYSLIFQIVTIS